MSQPKSQRSVHFCCAQGCAFQEGFNARLGAPIYGRTLGRTQVTVSARFAFTTGVCCLVQGLVKDLVQGLVCFPIQYLTGLDDGL
jgi:hypothetical protein